MQGKTDLSSQSVHFNQRGVADGRELDSDRTYSSTVVAAPGRNTDSSALIPKMKK